MLTQHSSPETTTLILETLLTFVSHVEGALELLRVEDKSPLTELADQHALVLDILEFMWTNASAIPSETMAVSSSIDKLMPVLIVLFQDTDGVALLRFVGNFMSKLMPEVSKMGGSMPRKALIYYSPYRKALGGYKSLRLCYVDWFRRDLPAWGAWLIPSSQRLCFRPILLSAPKCCSRTMK